MISEARRRAVGAARTYLTMRGYTVREENYRRAGGAEISLIVEKQQAISFVSVFYHADDTPATADLLTEETIRRLKHTALQWLEEEKWRGKYQYASLELAGTGYAVIHFVEHLF